MAKAKDPTKGAIEWTPALPCMFPYLWKQADKWGNKGKEWKIAVRLDPNEPEHKAFLSKVKAMLAECLERVGAKATNKPWRLVLDKDKQPTGQYLITFKTGYAPHVFDAHNNNKVIEEDNDMGNGSVVRVRYMPSWYTGTVGTGVTFYLQDVQLLDLVVYRQECDLPPLPPEYPDPLPTGQEDEDWLDAPAASDDEAVPTDDEIPF